MLELGGTAIAWLSGLILPFSRIAAFMLVAPIYSQVAAALRIRTIYAFALAIIILPSVGTRNFSAVERVDFNILGICTEVLLGFSIGMVLQYITAAVVTAGEQVATSMGIGFSQTFDPAVGPIPVVSRLLNIVALLVFIAAQGHTVIIDILLRSFEKFPPGAIQEYSINSMIEFSYIIFSGAALLSVPILLTLLAVNVALGVLSKATPSLNIFAIGFAANLLVGFGMLLLLAPVIVEKMSELWSLALQQEQMYFLK